ncbi:MAG: response regulator, partial [Steroidobacteraceae bacterium]
MSALLEAYLEEEGYRRVVTSNDPAGTVELLRDSQASLLLLDLVMPGVSGFDVLANVRADPELKYLPVIILTAANDAEHKLRALNLGATDFLSKPVDRSELVLRVRNSLAFRAYQDRLASMDPVTGLANRAMLVRRLKGTIRAAERTGSGFAVIQVDLDRF